MVGANVAGTGNKRLQRILRTVINSATPATPKIDNDWQDPRNRLSPASNYMQTQSENAAVATGVPSPARPRDLVLDAVRGFAIIAVVGIHATGHFLHYFPLGGSSWNTVAIANKALSFAVHCFLALSALLLTRKLMKVSTSPVREIFRRLLKLVPLYLLWSVIGLAVQGKHAWLTYRHALHLIILGKAYFHLYFMVLLLEMVPLVAICAFFARRYKSGVGYLVTVCLLQSVIYMGNRFYGKFDYSSTILWYLPSVGTGIWLGARNSAVGISRTVKLAWVFVGLCGFLFYLPEGVLALSGFAVNTLKFQVGLWLWSSAVVIFLVSVVHWPKSVQPALADIGQKSFIIYAAHPFVFVLLGLLLPLEVRHVWPELFLYFILGIAVPWILSCGFGLLTNRRSLELASA